ncbi:DJ-1 family glyoxalase III [Fusobacterium sp. PH5-44]|uniref:DJ-1 family glyoxalase III n=1 Tax=unclassified Fusobacterium TaxID=2648384 RepID=UPI003D20C317
MKKVYLLLAEGFETIEALAPLDILRRCDVDIKTVSITDNINVTSSQGVTVNADIILNDSLLDDGHMLILPGGAPGYVNLGDSKQVGTILKNYYHSGKYVAAICGAPTVLVKNAVAIDKKLTCHSGVVSKIGNHNYIGGDTVIDDNLITANGAGSSLKFGFLLAELLVEKEKVAAVKKGMEIK